MELGTKNITNQHVKMLSWLHLPNKTEHIPACLDTDPDLTWADPIANSTTLGLVAKVMELGTKKHNKSARKNAELVTSPQQNRAHPGLSRYRSRPDLGSG